MRRAIFIFVWSAWLAGAGSGQAMARAQVSSEAPGAAVTPSMRAIDGVAARIEDDILTESERRELAAFQRLVDGQAKSRAERIRELADQWIVRGEARAAEYPHPSQEDVDRAYAQLAGRFPSTEEFRNRCAAVELSPAAIRRMLEQQLYLSRFLDYRFRPAAQVDQKQIAAYYQDEFAPPLKARGAAVPSLESVEETIREVLVQRAISERAAQWLDATRNRLKIDIVPEGDRP